MNALQNRLAKYRTLKHRYPKPAILARSSWVKKDFIGYCDSIDQAPFSDVTDACDIVPRLPQGWYTDTFQCEILIGIVLMFRDPNNLNPEGSHCFYMAGTRHSMWDIVRIDLTTTYDNAKDAAYAADALAEREAECYREEDEKFKAQEEISRLKELIHELNQDILPLLKELKQQNPSPAVCVALHGYIKGILEERSQAFKRIQTLNRG